MYWRYLLSLSFLLLVFSFRAKLFSQGGNLIIAGGGLHPDNAGVFREIIRLSGGDSAILGIVPTAGGSPVQAYLSLKDILLSYGLKENQIKLIKIATEDDTTTQENESLWILNAYDTGICVQIKECTGLWFTGGDQIRVTKTLLTPDGKDTPALKSMRYVLARGGMIGGTSAGAAIQSEIMIGGGTSMGALMYGISYFFSEKEVDCRGKLFVTRGLGFFTEGVIDQHFDKRARLGRLAVALNRLKEKYTLGFGIDENTALIYDLKNKILTVKGVGGVSLLDMGSANVSYSRGFPILRNLIINYLTSGDSLKMDTMEFIPNKNKLYIKGKEYYNTKEMPCTGLLSGSSFTLADFISVYLIDNKSCNKISNVTFCEHGLGFRLEFRKTEDTQGFREDLGDDERYSFWEVKLDIKPVEVRIKDIEIE